MGYDYLITLIKVVLGLVTPERLMYFAFGVIGVFLLWVILSLAFSFPRRFYTKSAKLYSLLKKDAKSANSADLVKKYSRKISNGFDYGWNRFMKAESGKPSDFITRSDALENDVSGGVFNQGKSIMKSFIWLMTVLLAIVNLGYHGGENPITFMLLVESSVLPVLFFCALRIFYYLYTVVRQQLYKLDVESFYELIELLDETFEKKPLAPRTIGETSLKTYENEEGELKPNFAKDEQVETNSYALSHDQKFDEVSVSESETEEKFEQQTEQENNDDTPSSDVENAGVEVASSFDGTNQNEATQIDEQPYETEPENELDKYDVFKKKNINVDELANEVPKSSKTLPFINVDSDYVIKDDVDAIFGKRVSAADNGSTVLGVMQDMSSMKKEKSSETEEDQDADPDAETQNQTESDISETENEEEVAIEKEVEPAAEYVTEETELDAQAENSFEEESQNDEILTEETETESEPQIDNESESQEQDDNSDEEDEETFEPEVEETSVQEEVLENSEANNASSTESVDENESDVESEQNSENEDESRLANIVSNFKSSSAKQVKTEQTEDAEPIARRKARSVEPVGRANFSNQRTPYGANMNNVNGTATNYQGMYQGANAGYVPGFGFPQSGGFDGVVGYENYFGTNPADFGQNVYDPDYKPNFQEQILAGAIPRVSVKNSAKNRKPEVKEPQSKPQPKAKPEPKVLEPKQKSTVKEKKIMPEIQDQEPAKKRGRPKKQVFDDEVIIGSDKEFDEVLSRAEKLMRKSEEGLSASQSKRIEKELKMLMDAMNKYKEKR